MNDEAVGNEGAGTAGGKRVGEHKKWLVQEGDRIGRTAKGNRDWKHQVRTVWEAARLETEPLVVLNLLRYQAARNPGNWRRPADVYQELETAIEGCRKKAGDDDALAMELVRHLLAYTYRSYTFHAAEKPT